MAPAYCTSASEKQWVFLKIINFCALDIRKAEEAGSYALVSEKVSLITFIVSQLGLLSFVLSAKKKRPSPQGTSFSCDGLRI